MKAFTLIETMIYIAIIGTAIVSFVTFAISISSSRSKTYVVQEVHGNMRTALDLVSQRIRASTGVNTASSTFISDPGVLFLSMASSSLNPTIIDLTQNDGVLQIKEGTSDAVSITSDEVKVTNLVFTDLTASSSRENIRIQLTIEFDNPSGDKEFEYLQSIQTSVSVRQ